MKDAITWLLVSAIWYLIGVMLTDWIFGVFFLVFPLLIGLVGGVILARLKHHHLHNLIEHDVLEIAVCVTAGAVAFIATILLIILLLPANSQIPFSTLYWLLLVPAGITLATSTYLSAKKFANTQPTRGGLATILGVSVAVVFFGGLLFTTAIHANLHTTAYIPIELPESEFAVLNDLAATQNNLRNWSINPQLEPITNTQIINVHSNVKISLSHEIVGEYIKAQQLLLNPPNTTREDLVEHRCYDHINTTPTHNQPRSQNTRNHANTLNEYFINKLIQASTLDDMIEQIDEILQQAQQTHNRLYPDLLANAPRNESAQSKAVRYHLLLNHLNERCPV